MIIDWNLVVNVSSPIIALFVGAVLNHFLENRPKVIAYLGHVSGISLKRDKPVQINTHSVVLRNVGRKTSTNIKLGHNVLPDFQVFPDVEYQIINLPGGGREILIPKLVPQKQITISYLYFPPLTWDQINTHLESDEGPLKVLKVLPTIQYPKWVSTVVWLLILYGAIGLIYTIYEILNVLCNKT